MALEYTAEGPRPLLNVTLIVRAFPVFLQVTNDATGRYSLAAVPLNNGGRSVNVSIALAPGSGDYAPCPSGSDSVTSDTTFDVHMVSAALLSTAGPPSMLPWLGSIWVSGTVFENTPQGIPPIAGASVHLVDAGPAEDASDPRFSSNTLTDAAGRTSYVRPFPEPEPTRTPRYASNVKATSRRAVSLPSLGLLGFRYRACSELTMCRERHRSAVSRRSGTW
jgi:hypothetical protein